MVNDFVRTLPNLQRYMYFSTAYVAGTREGILRENELIRPRAFKTTMRKQNMRLSTE